ncbi:hypothetical protein [Aliiroseovarius sp. PrR006]|uniref:hypothetical protein n=1 Tax=Aliiroseovarius sp. PrR006 TaxID=2706883 RepID=UPI0013D2A174|nr:hypothetical protein [Aliiroseovarius sp. PrR006]NDW52715.1 hypothetical protein [Aliiroseovarius sp. PrR006]
MSDISELETRITTALERINAGLDKWADQPSANTDEVDALTRQLDDERTANAQLNERLSTLKDQMSEKLVVVENALSQLQAQLAQAEASADALRQSNQELRSSNDALRAAASTGVVEPALINDAMGAELTALRATQQADRAELDAVLSELTSMATPVSEEDTHA